ncbi:MAG: hypothetical protein FJ220_05645 [Kiritimatiellaceae bacterium]|nr:hypothetical protein [Kiritimatiellaceae bacterium]
MKSVWISFIAAVVYATVRYNICKGIPWCEWPTYILNKALALSALILLVVYLYRLSRGSRDVNDKTLHMAGLFASMHVFLSLILLATGHYEKFLSAGKLTCLAGWSLLLGTVVTVFMRAVPRTKDGQSPRRELQVLAFLTFLVGLHAMLPQYMGWFTPSKWPGFLPPITLISFALGLIALWFGFFPRKKG